ncbi:MAG: hypothetical protein LBC31_12865 [Treponema sp.]|jgi:hypothetical protein|nr:hypothetical protein [Treponema sp.]
MTEEEKNSIEEIVEQKINQMVYFTPMEMTVTDSQESTTNQGTQCYVTEPSGEINPYLFYASKTPNPASSADPQKVSMVLPLGGDLSGLYRFPKVGEKVLVLTNSTAYYMMGYIPASGSSFEEKPKESTFLAGQGEVFRYKQTGKKEGQEGDEPYSEIGFYRKATQWRTTDTNYRDVPPERTQGETEAAYSARLAAAGFPKESGETDDVHIKRVNAAAAEVFPRIDRINIHSTGDIHESAVNHHRVQAKRFEILAGLDDFEHHNNEKILPGDIPGDDGTFHDGDVHIRAGKRILIKAEDSIVIQVGRTSVEISDDGFSVSSRMVATALPNVYDAVLKLAPRDGVSITGQEVKITGQRSLSIGDGYGGSLETELGVMEIKAREVSIEDSDRLAYGVLTIANGIKYILSMVSGSMGMALLNSNEKEKKKRGENFAKAGRDLEYCAEKIPEIAEWVEECIGIKDADRDWNAFLSGAPNTRNDYRLSGITGGQVQSAVPTLPTQVMALSPARSILQTLVGCLDFILKLTSVAYTAAEAECIKSREKAGKKEQEQEHDNWKDKLNLAALVIDNTIIVAALAVLTGLGGLTASKIELKADGKIVMSADTIQHVYNTDFFQCATPSTAFQTVARTPKIVMALFKVANIGADIAKYSNETPDDNQGEDEEVL